MRTPGALELLSAFEKLPSDVRGSLVNLVRTLTATPAAPKEMTPA
jgi:hypothetical protein